MSLVAYENSDSSDYEGEKSNDATTVISTNRDKDPTKPVGTIETILPDDGQSLFNHLPQPTNKKPMVAEEDDEFLHKKESSTNIVKPKAKITVPSLDDFKDVVGTIPSTKPKVANTKKSGLLSILPQPKNSTFTTKATTNANTTTSFIPHILTKKPETTAKKKDILPSLMKKSQNNNKSLANYSDDSDNEDAVENDFFSINKPIELPPLEDIPLHIDQKIRNQTTNITAPSDQRETRHIQSYFKHNGIEHHTEGQAGYSESSTATESESGEASSYSNYEAPETSNNGEVVLDEEAILKLCGARGKRKREEIQIVDVNQQEVLADAREWLLKGLMDDTSNRVSASKKKGNEPTGQQKRKHQITYLAHQAKANEAELQNQWANNRMSKRKTQSKYGF